MIRLVSEQDPFDCYLAIGKKNGITKSYWSISADNDFINMSFNHPYVGATEVSYPADMQWGKASSVKIEGPTWLDLWKAADKAIQESGDEHHVFIEDFYELENGVLQLHTGS
jgi:hypothetical protein